MSTAMKRLAFHARNCSHRRIIRSPPSYPAPWRRSFSTDQRLRRPSEDQQTQILEDFLAEEIPSSDEERISAMDVLKSLTPEERKIFYSLPPVERNARLRYIDEYAQMVQNRKSLMETPDELEEWEDEDEKRPQEGFWLIGEKDKSLGEDEEFRGDDISSLAHAELQQHREIREYARLAAWELPLLSQYARPFEPPTSQTPLRFRYTTYMGEPHPAQNKVVVEFSPSDLPELTQVQRNKLIKLCGARYNPSTNIVKMSCEMFEEQAQNKRYLGDLVDKLLAEARDSTDTFEDVPFDFRHHKPKKTYQFPEEWLLTPERKRLLEEGRQQRAQLDAKREAEGTLVDGLNIVTAALSAGDMEARKVPEMIQANVTRSAPRRLR